MKWIRIVNGVGGCNLKLDDHARGFIKMVTFKQWLMSLANFQNISWSWESRCLGYIFWMVKINHSSLKSWSLFRLLLEKRPQVPVSQIPTALNLHKGSLLKPLIFNCFSKFVFILSNTSLLFVPSHCAFLNYYFLFGFLASAVGTSFGMHLLKILCPFSEFLATLLSLTWYLTRPGFPPLDLKQTPQYSS